MHHGKHILHLSNNLQASNGFQLGYLLPAKLHTRWFCVPLLLSLAAISACAANTTCRIISIDRHGCIMRPGSLYDICIGCSSSSSSRLINELTCLQGSLAASLSQALLSKPMTCLSFPRKQLFKPVGFRPCCLLSV